MNDLAPASPDARRFVFAVARRIVRDEEDAADVAQDALLLAYRHRDSFRGESGYRTWLYRIATTAALSHLRSRRRSRERVGLGDEPVESNAPDHAPSPEELVSARETERLLLRAVEDLGDKYRSVLLLRAEDLPEVEIARRLGLSVANVKIRTHRARQQVRDALGA